MRLGYKSVPIFVDDRWRIEVRPLSRGCRARTWQGFWSSFDPLIRYSHLSHYLDAAVVLVLQEFSVRSETGLRSAR